MSKNRTDCGKPDLRKYLTVFYLSKLQKDNNLCLVK